MIEGLESRFKVEECSFDTIYGTLDVCEIWAPRDVALKIEKQTRLQAQLGHTYLKMTSVNLKADINLRRKSYEGFEV